MCVLARVESRTPPGCPDTAAARRPAPALVPLKLMVLVETVRVLADRPSAGRRAGCTYATLQCAGPSTQGRSRGAWCRPRPRRRGLLQRAAARLRRIRQLEDQALKGHYFLISRNRTDFSSFSRCIRDQRRGATLRLDQRARRDRRWPSANGVSLDGGEKRTRLVGQPRIDLYDPCSRSSQNSKLPGERLVGTPLAMRPPSTRRGGTASRSGPRPGPFVDSSAK